MKDYRVTAKCESGHEQTIIYRGVSEEQVRLFAGLLDGTSPAYRFPPGNGSVIGKCGVCGKPFKATVEESADAVQ